MRSDDEIRADLERGDYLESLPGYVSELDDIDDRLAHDVAPLLAERDQARAALAKVRTAAKIAWKAAHETDESRLLQAAKNLEGGYPVGGSCTTEMVAHTLRAVASLLAAAGVPEPPTGTTADGPHEYASGTMLGYCQHCGQARSEHAHVVPFGVPETGGVE